MRRLREASSVRALLGASRLVRVRACARVGALDRSESGEERPGGRGRHATRIYAAVT